MLILTGGERRVGILLSFFKILLHLHVFLENLVFFNVSLLCSFILSDVALYFEEAGLFSQQILILMHFCRFLFFLESYSFCILVLH